jgi:death-on-curing protein
VIYLSISEVVELHRRIIEQSGGSTGLRDLGRLESSVMEPLQTFNNHELYPAVIDKAAALGYFLIQNHPFVDGNKRVGHAALETLLVLNGWELSASLAEQESTILGVARGDISREEFTRWVEAVAVHTAG